jgi:hypothetical protein
MGDVRGERAVKAISVDLRDLVPDCLPREPTGVTRPASAQGP